MAIQRIGEKLIKKFFVERDDYELLVKYSELKINQFQLHSEI